MPVYRLSAAIVLLAGALALPFGAAQGANLTLVRGARLVCPIEEPLLGVALVNLAPSTEIIPAGAVLTLTFSEPVSGIFNLPPGMAAMYSGSTATVTVPTAVTVAPNAALWFSGIRLRLLGLASGVPIGRSTCKASSPSDFAL